ncbi:MAG: LPXTG cell wall anchor domain-containing protein [Anaerolineaceae bacterium]
MDKLREQLSKPLISGVVGLIIGLIIGLPILGWVVWPVQWTDAAPYHLRKDLQVDYLKMTIDSYLRTENGELAAQRWNELGVAAQDALEEVRSTPGEANSADIEKFAVLVNAAGGGEVEKIATTPEPGTGTEEATVVETTEDITSPENPAALATPPIATKPTTGKNTNNTLTILLAVMCGLTVLIGGALAYLLMRRNKIRAQAQVEEGEIDEEEEAPEAHSVTRAEVTPKGEEPPVAQFMTSYSIGDDLYDDSFSIDAPNAEFLGECGVGISDTVGVGEPKKVSAFEVWLFDKNDIQTVTKVLMSPHAFNDPQIRQRLASKGEPVLMEAGKRIMLETATLQLEARVVDMNYGSGALPPSSFFDRLTLELAVWPKNH